jgi:hypothetical protein
MGPYRTPGSETRGPAPYRLVFEPARGAERLRLLTGSLYGAYLAAWTVGWSGGAWPHHALALDATLIVMVALLSKRSGRKSVVATLAIPVTHLLLASGLVPVPRGGVQWGVASVASGFLLLMVSLIGSYAFRGFDPRAGA